MEDRWTEDRCTEDRCTEDQREKKTRLAVYADFHGIKMPAAVILYSDMDETSVFDRLAASLSREERKQVLAAIQLNIDQNLQPIQTGDVIPPPVAEQVQNLGLWGRIGLFLMRVFTRSEEEEIITRWTLNALRSRVRKEAGGKVDMTRELFLEPFAQDLDQLREVVSRCSTFIETVAKRRTELVFRLAADEIPMINRDLLQHTSEQYLEELDERDERSLRRKLTSYLEERLADVPDQSSTRIRRAVAQVDELIRFCELPFTTMMNSFSGSAEAQDRFCAFDYISHSVERLAAQITRLSEPFERCAVESMVFLVYDEKSFEAPEDLQTAIHGGVELLLGLVGTIREFAQRFPLVSIVRLTRSDPWWRPEEAEQAGHDWLALYRRHFEERITRTVLLVSLHRQAGEQMVLLEEIIDDGITPLEGLPGADTGIRLVHWYRAAAVSSFCRSAWRGALNPLRLILNGADFYKSSNRAQYNDAFNEFDQIPQAVAALEALIRPDGDWGATLHGDESLARRREIASRVDEELEKLINGIRTNLETLKNLLGGVLYARPGSPYDTISNYGQLGGRRNAELIEEIKGVHTMLQRFVAVLMELEVIEKRGVENSLYLLPPT
jgi:hypothetical protein